MRAGVKKSSPAKKGKIKQLTKMNFPLSKITKFSNVAREELHIKFLTFTSITVV